MVYVAGYNSLTSFAGKDIAEMRKVGSGEELRVTAFVKRLEQQAAHRMVIGKDGKNEERENLGRGRRLRLAADAGRVHPLVEGQSARRPLRAGHLEPRLGLGSARLRRALREGPLERA